MLQIHYRLFQSKQHYASILILPHQPPRYYVSCVILWTLLRWVGQYVSIYKNDHTHPPRYHVSCIISYIVTLSRTLLVGARQYLNKDKNYHTHPPRYHVSCIISFIVTLLRTFLGWVGKYLNKIKNHLTHPPRYHVSCLMLWIYHGLFHGGQGNVLVFIKLIIPTHPGIMYHV